MTEQYDVIIVGAGLVGASLALSLQSHNLRVAMVEAKPIAEDLNLADNRAIALAYRSRSILQSLKLWSELEAYTLPIKTVHVSEQGRFGHTRFTAEEMSVPALGYVMPMNRLQHELVKNVGAQAGLDWYCPAVVSGFQQKNDRAELVLNTENGEQGLIAKLVVAADGLQSALRTMAQIESETLDYQQTAIVAPLALARGHNNIAYERFGPNGVVAMLPIGDNKCTAVCTESTARVDGLMELSDEEYLQALQQRFGYRLGRFEAIGQRRAFPLVMNKAKQQVKPNLVLLGNSAHSIHPMAAQGFNLSLRDVMELSDIIINAVKQGQNFGDIKVLESYIAKRRQDQQRIMGLTHGVTKLFSSQFAPLSIVRSIGLTGLQALTPMRKQFAERLMGVR